MTTLALVNYILQIFFIRICSVRDKERNRMRYCIMGFVLPFTGWAKRGWTRGYFLIGSKYRYSKIIWI